MHSDRAEVLLIERNILGALSASRLGARTVQAGDITKQTSDEDTYLNGICIESIPDSAHFSITYALSVMGWSLGTARNR